MAMATSDNVSIDIINMLNSLSSSPSEPSIFRVGEHLRNMNPDAYDPKIIAIGPIHRNKPQLGKMERYKAWYLKRLLERKRESVEIYVNEIRGLADMAWKCYAEEIELDRDEFLKMLPLDGCFIVEFLWKLEHIRCRDQDDQIFQYGHILNQLMDDLMLFENQIPFFVVDHLFKMINTDNYNIITHMIWPLLRNGIYEVQHPPPQVPQSPHLLGIVHDIQCSLFAEKLSKIDRENGTNEDDMRNMGSAIELQQSGISFEKSNDKSLFHIEFKNKTISIPVWEISDSTEPLFHNLIAYEYYQTDSQTRSGKHVIDYVVFMHCLIHSPDDVKLLRRCGIIHNLLEGDEMAYRVIKELVKDITPSNKFSYFGVSCEVKRYCNDRRNRWKTILRRDYFNTPWSLINFVLGAITLLILTVIQTTFAVLSYRNDLNKGS